MGTRLLEAPFSGASVSEFRELTKRVFGEAADESWLDSLKWRLERMPDVSVFVTEADSRWIGFKAGYAIAQDRYYSWLGGVDPEFRKQGIAKEMMRSQHNWLLSSRFQLLETHVEQDNEAMVRLNINNGLSVTGLFMKSGKPYFVMQKRLARAR